MASRHVLPSGGWVELREGGMLRARDQKRMLRSIPADDRQNPLEVGLSVTSGMIALMVVDWKLPYPPAPTETDTGPQERDWLLPSQDLSMVDDLSMPDYNRLVELVKPEAEAAFPGKPDPSDYDNPASPTGPANA